ncbi:MAG: FHA domain-containing protein [Myxococcales bacterium]|nr:FHA domain-containing protein [Myxococcales bacterium]
MQPGIELLVLEGTDTGQKFTVDANEVMIGRRLGDSELPGAILLHDSSVSTRQAVIRQTNGSFVIEHLSEASNPTLVNGSSIQSAILVAGSQIQIGRILMDVRNREGTALADFTERYAPAVPLNQPGSHFGSEAVEIPASEIQLGGEFSVEGSFMDIDIVNSIGMKEDISEPERIIVSFERFRCFITRIVNEFQGHVLNSNGDELICFFASSLDAIRAGSAVSSRLDLFNQNENTLDAAFRLRIGVHSGKSLVDLKRGIAYNAVLDVAGQLQRVAKPERMTISEQTMAALPRGLPFKFMGRFDPEDLDYYTLDGVID